MFAFEIDEKKIAQIPYTLKEWTGNAGPKTLVRELELVGEGGGTEAQSEYTLKGWAHYGAHSQLVALGYC